MVKPPQKVIKFPFLDIFSKSVQLSYEAML